MEINKNDDKRDLRDHGTDDYQDGVRSRFAERLNRAGVRGQEEPTDWGLAGPDHMTLPREPRKRK